MPTISKEEYIRRVTEFLDKYQDSYSDFEKLMIKGSAADALTKDYINDSIRQIYDELGLLQERHDIYSAFLKILEENFDINQNMIEVGAGVVPSLAKRISRKKSFGTIEVYDPRLITPYEPLPNMILKKEQFSENTPLSSATLLIGFMPCEATPIILDSAIKHEVDFIVALCEGGSRRGYEYLEEDEEWISMMEYIASTGLKKGKENKVLKKASLIKYGDPYPVIYSKTRKP